MATQNIPKLRKDLHLNQTQFANLMGVHPITVSRWERGKVAPTPYQEAFLNDFSKASHDESIRNIIATVLITAGITAAILLLLKAAQKTR